MVKQMIFLGRHLVDAVDVDRFERMRFRDRQLLRPAINLSSAGEDDFDLGIAGATGFENGNLRETIDLQVGQRILHGIDVARLPGEIEKIMLPLEQRTQAVQVAHIGDVDVYSLARFDIETIAAVFRHEAVDQSDIGAEFMQAKRQVRADEAEPAGDQNFLLREMLLHQSGLLLRKQTAGGRGEIPAICCRA